MIEYQQQDKNSNKKITQVILHSYTLKKVKNSWSFTEDQIIDLNDGKRHKVRSFTIAYDDKPYPTKARLQELLGDTPSHPMIIQNHSNIKTSQDYIRLGNFCPLCLQKCKQACNKKFGWTL